MIVRNTRSIRQLLLSLTALVTLLVLTPYGAGQATQGSVPPVPQVDNGTNALGTYDGVHDKVSVMSGNLSFCIPMISLPGQNKHDLNIPLCYNSQFEQPYFAPNQTSPVIPIVSWFPWVWPSNTPVMGPGWTLTGRIGVYTSPATANIIFMPDGGEYQLLGTQTNGSPNITGLDSSGAGLLNNGTWIYQKNGTRSTAAVSTTTQEYDSYGSLITFTPSSVTDTLGRSVTVSTSAANGSSPASMSFSYLDSNEVTQKVTIQFVANTNACGPTQTAPVNQYGTNGTYSMPSAVILPDGLTYTFQYDSCGNVNKVTYPSGGYTRYTYAPEPAGISGPNPNGSGTSIWQGYQLKEVVNRYVCSVPSLTVGATSAPPGDTCAVPEETTTYAPAAPTFASTGNTASTVTDPLGNSVAYQFTQPVPQNAVPALESSRIYYDKVGNILQSVQTAYNTVPGNGQLIPTLPMTQTTVLGNGATSQIQWTYDLRSMNLNDSPLLEKREYDYGMNGVGPLLRTTDYYWLHLYNPAVYGWNYMTNAGAHVIDRETSEIVYAGAASSNNIVSQVKYHYDNGQPNSVILGTLTAVERWRNTDNSWLTTNYQWDTVNVPVNGNSSYSYYGVIQKTDPNGEVTNYNYADNYADGVTRYNNAAPTTITHVNPNGISSVEHKQYYWGSGLVAASCGQNFTGTCRTGLTSQADYTSYIYDLMGRNVAMTTGDGGSTTTCYSEVPGGSCPSGSYPITVMSTEAIGSGVVKTSTTTLDGLARQTQTRLTSDPACSTGSLAVTTYDLDERVSTKSNPYCSPSDPTYGVTTNSYDGLSRVTQVINPDGTSTKNIYVGRAVLSSDEGNGTVAVQRISQKDALGRLTGVCETSSTTQQGSSNNTPGPCGLDYPQTGFLTSYSYDVLGNLLYVTQGAQSRNFVYDSLSRLRSASNPESGYTQYGYDADGNLTSKTSAAGITTTYAYDGLNRLLGKSYSDGVTPSACFQYDQGTNGIGRLSSEWTQAGSCSNAPPVTGALTERTFAAYDLMGRVVTDQQCSSPGNCSAMPNAVTYGYDLAGDVTSFTNGLTGNASMEFSNTYDSAGRLSMLIGPTAAGNSYQPVNLFTSDGYNPAGAIVNAQIGTGITLTRTYDNRLRPTSETDQVATAPGTATIQITGSEQSSASTTGSIVFSGTEQSSVSNGSTTYDDGEFVVSFGSGQTITLLYNQCSTPQSLAQTLAAQLSCAYEPVSGVATGSSVQLTSCTSGTGTNYPINAYFDGHSSSFSTPSFAVTTSGRAMSVPTSTYATGTLVFSGASQPGTEVFDVYTGPAGPPSYLTPASTGTVTGSTPTSLAAALAADIPSCSTPGEYFSAMANGPVVTLTSCTAGAAGDYPINFIAPTGGFFSMAPSGSTLTGGTNAGGIYDQGGVILTVNGVQIASAPYQAGSTPSSIASALVSSGSGNDLVTLSANGANVTLTAKDGGTLSDYSYAVTVNYDTASFGQPSFEVSSPSGSLANGTGNALYNWVINSYAPDGNVLSMTDSVMGTWSYGYDDLNRLTTASASAGSMSGANLGWNYDRYGNRWNQTLSGNTNSTAVQTSFTFNGNSNQIDRLINNYDADGNLLNDGNHSYAYDAENRIISMNGQSTYIYDAEGKRVAKYSGGTLTATYILGLGGEQITELNSSNQWAHSNVFAPGGRMLATYEGPAGQAAPGYHYHLTDWLGTERLQTNTNGNEDEHCVSYPFGDGLSCSGPNAADATEHHFTGKERDTESGLDYFGARYLSSNFGRFMTPDWAAKPSNVPYATFGDPQSLNLYAYVGNNPNTGIDFDGHVVTMQNGVLANEVVQDAEAAQQADTDMSWLEQNAPEVAEAEEEGDAAFGMGSGPSDALKDRADAARFSQTPEGKLTALIFAEATNGSGASDAEKAAIGYTPVNRAQYLKRHSHAKAGLFGAKGRSLDAIINANRQFVSVGGRLWNMAMNPGNLTGVSASSYSVAKEIATGVLAGVTVDPYASQGGTFAFKTAGSGSPGGSYVQFSNQIEGSNNTFYGMKQ